MRTWTRIAAVLLLTVPFTASAFCADPEITDKKRIADLEQAVKDLKYDMEILKAKVDTSNLRGAKTAEDLQLIISMLKTMPTQQDVVARQAGYDARSNATVPNVAMPATSTITLENVFSTPATVRINDREFRIEPYQTRKISGVPVGTFRYSVDVDGYGPTETSPRSDNLPPSGYRIRIFPRMPS